MMKNPVADFAKKNMMVIALVVVVIAFSILTNGTILTASSLDSLISQNGYVFMLATGMLLCILTGGNIDLAVGSVVCFTGGIGALLMKVVPFPIAVLAMLAIGFAIGAFQGYWIAWVSVPPFIATLAGMFAFRGLANVVMGGYAIDVSNEGFLRIFGGGAHCYVPDFIGKLLGITIPIVGAGGQEKTLNITCLVIGVLVVIALVVMLIRGMAAKKGNALGDIVRTVIISALVLWLSYKLACENGIPSVLIWIALVLGIYGYITNYTAIGRYFYAVGGNEKATRLSGINTKLVYFIAYANMGFLAGLGGILTIARAKTAQPTFGQGYEMDAIAACFIGGASAYGGVGKITGVIIGAILMGVINQGMIIKGISPNYQVAVKGVVLLIAVMMDVLSQKEKA